MQLLALVTQSGRKVVVLEVEGIQVLLRDLKKKFSNG